jgi:diadenosine tetraphosphate (Ap4A) HIT family hydrolase
MLTLVVFRIPTGLRAWIEDVVVDEAVRGRGVGEVLSQEAVRRALGLGARTVELTSRPSREAANRPYQRLGFVRRDSNVYREGRASFKPEHIHVCSFGHSPGHTVHFHVIPVYEWMKHAYRRLARTDAAVQYPSFADGASLTLFVSEEFTRRRAPCEIPEPSVEHVIRTLKDVLHRDAAKQAAR